VKLIEESYSQPRLEWHRLYIGDEFTGEILATFQLIEVCVENLIRLFWLFAPCPFPRYSSCVFLTTLTKKEMCCCKNIMMCRGRLISRTAVYRQLIIVVFSVALKYADTYFLYSVHNLKKWLVRSRITRSKMMHYTECISYRVTEHRRCPEMSRLLQAFCMIKLAF
jgi:hypothetical protein